MGAVLRVKMGVFFGITLFDYEFFIYDTHPSPHFSLFRGFDFSGLACLEAKSRLLLAVKSTGWSSLLECPAAIKMRLY